MKKSDFILHKRYTRMSVSHISNSHFFLLRLLITCIFFVFSHISFALESSQTENSPTTEAPWMLQQVVQLQDRIVKLEILLLKSTNNSGDIKSAEKELQQMQLQLVELKEKLNAQVDNQSKELVSYDRRISDVSLYTNIWGALISVFGMIITIAAIFMGWSAKNKAIGEAKYAVESFFTVERESLINAETKRFEDFRSESKSELKDLQRRLKLQNDQLIARASYNRAQEYEKDGKFDIAISSYNDLINKFNDSKDIVLLQEIAASLFRIGVSQNKLGKYEQALNTYEEIITRFCDETDLTFKEQVARAMVNKGVIERQKDLLDEAISTYQKVVFLFGNATELSLKEPVAKALYNKAIAEKQKNSHEAAILSYEEVVNRFGNATDLSLQGPVAWSLYNKGVVEQQQKLIEAAIESYNDLILRFGDTADLGIKETVANALFNRGGVEREQNQIGAAISSYNEVISRFDDSTELKLQTIVAKSLLYRGVLHANQDSADTAMSSFNEIARRFGDATELSLKELVAKAFLYKGNLEVSQHNPNNAVLTYNELTRRFGDATELSLKELVASSLLHKGAVEDLQDLLPAAISSYNEVLSRYGTPLESSLKECVATAHLGIGSVNLRQGKKHLAEEKIDAAIIIFEQALPMFSDMLFCSTKLEASGIVLWKRSYLNALLGNMAESGRLFMEALRAQNNGGCYLYDFALADLNNNTVEQDKYIRKIIEEQWLKWQTEQG